MQNGNEMRAIVVDDSSAMRSLLRLILSSRGFDVAEAKNGKIGLELLSKCGVMNLALIDWNMPEMGGLELLNAIRSDTAFDAMRIMIVTTETDLEQVQRALSCGANEYVMKPFSPEILADKLSLMGF